MSFRYAENIPVLCVANKIDVDYRVTQKTFSFPSKHGLPFQFVSDADGTNVVEVFESIIHTSYEYKDSGEQSFLSDVLDLLEKS